MRALSDEHIRMKMCFGPEEMTAKRSTILFFFYLNNAWACEVAKI